MTALSVAAKPPPAGTGPGWPPVRQPDPALAWRCRRWHDRRWWLAAAFIAGGAGLIPWVVLATWVPAITRAWNWSAAWTGLDSLEALGLLGTGVLLLREDARYRLTAAAAAALLAADAWSDITTSAPGPGRVLAMTMAACLELPVTAVCAALAARLPRRQPEPPPITVHPAARNRRRHGPAVSASQRVLTASARACTPDRPVMNAYRFGNLHPRPGHRRLWAIGCHVNVFRVGGQLPWFLAVLCGLGR